VPPGTGKTHATIEAMLEILDQNFLAKPGLEHAQLKKRFDELVAGGQVHSVTFHRASAMRVLSRGCELRAVRTAGFVIA
jgi:hypothetical protein